MSGEEAILKGQELLKAAFKWVCKTVMGFADATGEADLEADPGLTLFLAVAIALLLGSAFWAAAIAASRRYKAVPHFFLGLVLPWVYPLVILFALDIKGAKKMREAYEAEMAAKKAAEEERQRNIAANMGTVVTEEPKGSIWNQEYFTRIARHEDGTAAGPWTVVFNGNGMKVLEIVDALPEVVCVICEDAAGSPVKLRIPYARMEDWKEA